MLVCTRHNSGSDDLTFWSREGKCEICVVDSYVNALIRVFDWRAARIFAAALSS